MWGCGVWDSVMWVFAKQKINISRLPFNCLYLVNILNANGRRY